MGRPKALIPAHGMTLLERTAGLAREVCDRVALLGAPRFELPQSLADLPVLADAHPGIGPMAGLESLFAAYPGEVVVLLSCDLPRLKASLLKGLIERADGGLDAVVYALGPLPEGWEPCCALYMPSAAAAVTESVRAGQYSLQRLLGLLRTHTIALDDQEGRMLLNVNRPEDLPGCDTCEGAE